ncbi:MAG TPA: GNAT family N-acetyltransferase [Gaiellaceae bacterium]|nr:GNAT family N-acetyltransferase [Gaiellaceae bacterium]
MAVETRTFDVILRDGSTLRLRPPTAADGPALLALFQGLSAESLHLRFHGMPALTAGLVEHVLEPDWAERGGLIGTLAADGAERVVAVATYHRLRDPAKAEVSFAVADDLQGRGIGTRLLEQLAALASAHGVERFVAAVLPENVAMLRVFSDAGFDVARTFEQGIVELEFEIAVDETYRARVDERDHAAVVASLRPFFEPQSLAVLGASPRPGSIGGELFRNVVDGGYRGRAYPVNRSGAAVAEIHGYSAIEDLPERVDLAVVCLPAELVLDAAERALALDVPALCVISAGFAELGREGAERQDRLLALVRAHGARLIGPNCLGIASAGASLNATFAPYAFPPGKIGFSSQSGALGLALLEQAKARGLGFSGFVSVGNKADVSSNDLLEWWEDDPATAVVLLYLESFGNPRRFGRIARRVARRKPILAMKSGVTRAGERAASSHTAALAGSEAGVAALFRQAGVIRCATFEELVDVAALLSDRPLPRGPGVAVLTNAGGLGILCADACDAAGLGLPRLTPGTRASLEAVLPPEASTANPVDMLGSASAELYERALPLVLADPAVASVIVIFVPAARVQVEDVAAAIARAAEGAEKPVLPVLMAAEPQAGSFAYPESAARALGRAVERSAWLRRPVGAELEPAGIDRRRAASIVEAALLRENDLWLAPNEAREVLEAYGIRLVPERSAEGPDAAAAVARELGLPVVVKTAEPGAHKTERGGVALDLVSPEEAREAAARIGGPVIVQRMVEGGVELLAGLVQDPVFGPLVAFGAGGVLTELIGEARFCPTPLTDVDARELVHAGKAGRLVDGFRARPPADADSLVDLLGRLSRLGEDLPEVAELDLNPVLGLESGYVVVDARIRVRAPAAAASPKTW